MVRADDTYQSSVSLVLLRVLTMNCPSYFFAKKSVAVQIRVPLIIISESGFDRVGLGATGRAVSGIC